MKEENKFGIYEFKNILEVYNTRSIQLGVIKILGVLGPKTSDKKISQNSQRSWIILSLHVLFPVPNYSNIPNYIYKDVWTISSLHVPKCPNHGRWHCIWLMRTKSTSLKIWYISISHHCLRCHTTGINFLLIFFKCFAFFKFTTSSQKSHMNNSIRFILIKCIIIRKINFITICSKNTHLISKKCDVIKVFIKKEYIIISE